MIARRKSLARRTPIVVYRLDVVERHVDLKAWLGDDQGRMLREHPLGAAYVDEYEGAPPRSQWLTSKDTEGLYAPPDGVRELVFEFDDAARSALR